MASDRRTEEEIRGEIAAEREQLVEALADLRQGVYEKRRLAAAVVGAILAGLTAVVVAKLVRRLAGA